jgi:alcohol dehydrogenase class IV
MVEAIVNTVLESTEKLLKDASDYDARAEFAWAATQALSGLLYSGTGGFSYPNHMIEHALSALFNVPHGAGLSVVMPAWMKWYQSRNPSNFPALPGRFLVLNRQIRGLLRWKPGLIKSVRQRACLSWRLMMSRLNLLMLFWKMQAGLASGKFIHAKPLSTF